MYSPSNSPSMYDNPVYFGIKILTNPANITNVDTYKTELITQLSTILDVSNDRFKISDFNIHLGRIYVYMYVLNSKISGTYTNNNRSNISLLTLLGTTLSGTIEGTYTILSDIDNTYGTNGIKLLKDNNLYTSLSSNIPVKTSILDQFINNDIPFALYTYVTNYSVPSISDKTRYKMYLTTSMTHDTYIPCEKDGMLSLNPTLTIGAVYNLNRVKKYFPKNSTPYKYIDFDSIKYNNMTKETTIVSTFYNLSLYTNGYSVSYCQQDCKNDNINGMCSQEKITLGGNEKSSKTGNYNDNYNLKNFMKIKEESDGTITPYFISLNPVEQIHFITNKISTINKPNDFQTIVKVPIYEDYLSYYETPTYNITNKLNYYTIEKTQIKNLNILYTQDEIDSYNNNSSFTSTETHAFKNTAYTDYSYSFYIEPISNQDIERLR